MSLSNRAYSDSVTASSRHSILQKIATGFFCIAALASFSSTRADNVDGAWSTLENWPLIALHAVITPDRRVLSYGTLGDGTQTGFFVYDVWDPAAGLTAGHVTLDNFTGTDLFCSSQIILPQSGDILIAGGDNWTGTSTTNTGNNDSNLFSYSDNALASSTSMNRSRWYSSATALVNGEIYIQGGNGGADLPEVRETTGGFRLLTGAPTGSYATIFPRNFLAPDGRVFGYDTNGNMFFVDTGGLGSLVYAGTFSSSYAGWQSGAAMFQPGRILQVGANSSGALVIDINGPTPAWAPTQSTSSRRRWNSATVLADGRVLVTGGSTSANQLVGVNKSAEIWDPDTGLWHVGSEGAVARLYHSSALLLPDASVLVAGGGAPGPLNNTNAEIYYPPYLYASGGGFATRPQIISAPDTANVGDNLAVQVDSSTFTRVAIVKTGSVTHSVNMDQRFVELPFTQSANMLSVNLPARASDTPPGFYLMFAIDDSGVPSEAHMLRINIDPSPNTAVDYTPAIGGSGGTSFQLACNVDEVLVGVHGKYATVVNQIGPQCVKMDQFGHWIGAPIDGPVTGTTSTGTSFSKTCPVDFAMSGFQGRSGSLVNQLNIECKALTPAGGLTGAGQLLGPDGGSGGTAQGLFACGTNNPVYALYGRSGSQIDSFGVQCRQGFITPISVNSDPVIGNPGTQSGTVGVPVNLQINASDGDVPPDVLTFSATGLPPGLIIGTDTGLITGAPTIDGTFIAEVTVTDGTTIDTANFDWIIDAVPPLSVEPMPAQLPKEVDTPIIYTASASGGTNVMYKWNFGDGSTETAYSSSPSITHTFTNPVPGPGVYYIQLTVKDDAGELPPQTFVQGVHLPLTTNSPSTSTNIMYEHKTVGNSRIWAVNQDNDTVSVFDASTHAKLIEIPVGVAPRNIAIAPDDRVWVTNKSSANISIIDPVGLSVVQTVAMPFGSQPYGIVFSPVVNEAYVVLQAAGSLLKLDGSTGVQLGSFDTGPNPRGVAIDAAGSSIYVSRFITPLQTGEDSAIVESQFEGANTGGEIMVVASASMTFVTKIVLQHSIGPDAENQGRGVPNYVGALAISPDGTSGRAPSKKDNIARGILRDPPFNLNFQNTVRAISSSIDLPTNIENFSKRIDYDNSSFSSAALFDPFGIYAFVALETSREVAVIDAYADIEIFRINVGKAPGGLAVSSDGMRLYVNNFMDRTVDVLDLTTLQTSGQWSVDPLGTLPSVGTEKLSAQVLLGKQLFYDAFDTRLAFDRYLSCATCHNDSAGDGRVWDITGMGEGLRNTINLSGRGTNHGRRHWSANFDEVQDFEGQIRGLSQGTGLMADVDFFAGTRSQPLGDPKAGVSADLDALAAYVDSLNEYASSPHRNGDGSLTADAIAGRQIFLIENCFGCHSGSEFTDSSTDALHDIGTMKVTSGSRLGQPLVDPVTGLTNPGMGLDTPTLRGVWESAPYLHDGAAETLADAILAHNSVSLVDPELSQLVAYLEQIDGLEAEPSEQSLDNLGPSTSQTGDWFTSGGADPYQGNSVYCNIACTFTWQPNLLVSGTYEVYAYWTSKVNRSTSVPYRIDHDGGTATVLVDQNDPSLGGQWNLLGTYDLTAGANGTVWVTSENGQASADAVRWVLISAVPPDETLPTEPTNLTATAISASQIDLSWTASTDNVAVAGYKVYQSPDYTTPVATTTTTSHTITSLASDTLYTFKVSAFDPAGNESGLSIEATATTLAPSAETIVDNLDVNTSQTGTWPASGAANPYLGNSVYCNVDCTFTWQPNLSVTGTYAVYAYWTYKENRSTNVPYRIDNDTGTDTKTVNQHDLALGGQWNLLGLYNFTAGVNGNVWVSSENGQASADALRWVLMPPDIISPSDPTNLTATANGATEIDLAWTASTDNVAVLGYNVYQDGDYTTPVAMVTTGTSHTVTGLAPITAYSFEVDAFDPSGNASGLSNMANATTLAATVETIVDNLDLNTSQTGDWFASSGADPYLGNSVYCHIACTFTWQPSLTESGTYEVYAYWTWRPNRSTTVPYRIEQDGGTITVPVNQQDQVLAGQWVLLGTFNLTTGVNGNVWVSSENGQASADAVRWVLLQ